MCITKKISGLLVQEIRSMLSVTKCTASSLQDIIKIKFIL